MTLEIKLYGTKRCHKTRHYQTYLRKRDLQFTFLDVEESELNARALKTLYKNKKLNFPTITIGTKKLRNPSDTDLQKWIDKLME
jgi:arsenate reductase-like glutaredoxin family protein